MILTDWLLSVSAASVAVTGYFIQRWINSVDTTLKSHSEILTGLAEEFLEIKVRRNSQKPGQLKSHYDRISQVEKAINRIVPQIEKQVVNQSRINNLERLLRDMEKKIKEIETKVESGSQKTHPQGLVRERSFVEAT